MHTRKLFYWSIVVALAGFLFGFDTVVISGADLSLQELWSSYTLFGSTEAFHGIVVMASALWGTVVGALFGSIPTNKLGRKNTLIWIGIGYTLSAVGSALVSDPWTFAAFRFIGGLAVGASTIAAPAYISEISPADRRGRLVALYQFNIVFGILVAFASNFAINSVDLGIDAWRWMIGVEAIPAVIYTLMILGVPQSPRWLLSQQGNVAKAQSILQQINPTQDAAAEVKRLQEYFQQTSANKRETIFHQNYRLPLLLAFLIAFFNQFSGINALLYYAPRIFSLAGLEGSGALLSSIGVGAVNFVATLVGMSLIDRVGRKQLMYAGSIGYIISLAMVAIAFQLEWQGLMIPIFLFVFIASHAIGQGTVIWVFISEIFPNHLRADGQAFGSSVHWVLAASIPAAVPVLFSAIGPAPVFACFAGMMVLQLLFVWKLMPETRGVSLEELGEKLKQRT